MPLGTPHNRPLFPLQDVVESPGPLVVRKRKPPPPRFIRDVKLKVAWTCGCCELEIDPSMGHVRLHCTMCDTFVCGECAPLREFRPVPMGCKMFSCVCGDCVEHEMRARLAELQLTPRLLLDRLMFVRGGMRGAMFSPPQRIL